MLPFLIAGLAALAVVVIAVGIAMSAGGGSVARASSATRRPEAAGTPTAGRASPPSSRDVAGASNARTSRRAWRSTWRAPT